MADTQQVKVVIQGEDKTGAAFNSATKNVSGLTTKLSGLTKVVGGGLIAGGAALTAFLYSSAKAAGDAEVAMARVRTTVERTVDTFNDLEYDKVQEEANKAFGEGADVLDYFTASVDKAANAAIKLGFDDEDAAESMAKLLQRTRDVTEAQQLQITAMDLARAKNIELSDAANLVGQVLSGNGRVLKQYGIELSDTLTPLQALGELQKQVGGQADAFAATFQGQMAILDVSFNNLKETIGAALLNAITPFIKQLSDWASKKETQEKIKEIAAALQYWGEIIIPVVVKGVSNLFGNLKNLYDILVNIEVKIFQVIDALERFYQASKKAVGGAASTVGSAWSNAGSNIKWALGLEGRASGGPVMSGRPYVVGERGPEMFVPSQSGTIIPNGSGGGGAISITITGNTFMSSADIADMIGSQIMQVLKNNIRI